MEMDDVQGVKEDTSIYFTLRSNPVLVVPKL